MGHTDDLQSIASTIDILHAQVEVIVQFVDANFWNWIHQSVSSSFPVSQTHSQNPPFSLKSPTASKCREAWWSPNLSPKVYIKKNIANAHQVFLAFGALAGAFQGKLSLLSCGTLCATSLSEWLYQLDPNGCPVRAIGMLSGWTWLSPLIGLGWPSYNVGKDTISEAILSCNLLDRTSTSLSSTILCSVVDCGKEEVALVQQCWFLEEPYESKLSNPNLNVFLWIICLWTLI